MFHRALILTTLLLTGSVVSLRAATTLPATSTQPATTPATLLTEPRTHDPSMIRDGNFYYVYSTGLGIQTKRSSDLLHWERLPPVFDHPPAWIPNDFPRAFYIWAPDLSFFNNQFHLYYCISNFGKNRSIIAFATSPTLDPASPNYHWTDHGKVFESLPTNPYNAIDPAITFDDTKTPWLTFGSFWDGIHLLRLSAATSLPDPADPTLYHLAARPNLRDDPIEAPCIIHRNNFYYLLVSFDYCCRGANSTYHMMIGRSEKITGPYLDQTGKDMRQGGGSLLLAGDPTGRLRGPGGGILYHDTPNNRWLLVHHFYDANDRGMSKLQIRPITWSPDNWPIAGQPLTDAPTTATTK
ncbi:MAG TPA: arabinan endo-1,5-alpha-L-arabinosidase [Phycisphaerae bacterium]|nr:arabinan endo-1,5-alpha-L-arabinosidase [Phycisphaerae bacterium]